ncbi:MAG: glycoside hydrolase family 16 protein [Oscillospiraceae bacterium]|nr:glycoside hydrolase family 16 protein [Oscillospiraceae bacterium]
MLAFLQQVFCFLLSVLYLPVALVFSVPRPAVGLPVKLSQFELVWSDEFDGTELNRANWNGHNGDVGPRRGGYWDIGMCTVRDGALHIASAYLEEGPSGGPAGYYTAGIDTRLTYAQQYGYFEVRCQLPKGQGLWSAFWLLTDGMANEDGTGLDGAEIDIFESPYYVKQDWWLRNAVSCAVHFDGYGDALQSKHVGDYFVSKPYDSFHTYGLEWNEDGYTYYIDGRKAGCSTFGGAAQVPEFLILSVEHETGGWAGDVGANTEPLTDFVVDYVRAYQYK